MPIMEDILKGDELSRPYANNIRQCIKRAGYKVYEVADELNIPRSTFANYLAGKRPVPHECLQQIAQIIGCEVGDLSLNPMLKQQPLSLIKEKDSVAISAPVHYTADKGIEQEKLHLSMDKLRRDLLHDMLSVGGAAFVSSSNDSMGLEVLERLARSLQKPSELNETMLRHLEVIVKTQWQMHAHSEDAAYYRRDMVHGISGQLHTLVQLLEHPLQTSTHNRLSSLVSEATQLIGEIFLFDMGDHSKAIRYYDAALVAAHEAQRDVLFAVTLGRKSFVSLYGGNSSQALLFLQAAHQVAEKSASDIIRAWLFAAEAEAHANLQNASSCMSALEKSEFFLHRAQQKEVSYSFEQDLSFSLFSSSMLMGYKGVCYMRLKKTAEAQTILQQDLSAMQPERIIHKSVTLVDLAMTYVQQGEVEEACKCLEQSLILIEQTKSAKTLQRILSSRQELDAWKDTASVKRLDAHLATVIATGTV